MPRAPRCAPGVGAQDRGADDLDGPAELAPDLEDHVASPRSPAAAALAQLTPLHADEPPF